VILFLAYNIILFLDMYFNTKTQPNGTFASMQRTHYPKYVSYYGNGTGRDHQVIMNNGGLTSVNKVGLGNTGVHIRQYHGPASHSRSASKSPPTFYYQSDGTGRDSYVLMDNGGYRPEYDKYNKSNEKIFIDSLRSG
jgi:hypothetical protein